MNDTSKWRSAATSVRGWPADRKFFTGMGPTNQSRMFRPLPTGQRAATFRAHVTGVACAQGVTQDPQNPLFRDVGKNYLKSRLRSHPDVARRHHADLLEPKEREGALKVASAY